MRLNAEVIFRDINSSPTISDTIYKKLSKLNRFTDSILHSKVTLDSPNSNKDSNSKAKIFRAQIELDLKGKPVLVSRDDASVHIAIRDAFSAAERKVKESRTKHRVKH